MRSTPTRPGGSTGITSAPTVTSRGPARPIGRGARSSSSERAIEDTAVERAKAYLLENFENMFVLVTLLSTAVVNHFVPAKLAFLNFYFLPIILAGYYLGRRSAVLGALLCALLMTVYVVLFPEAFEVGGSPLDVYTYIAAWAGFLILAGAVVGRLQEKLADEVRTTGALNQE